MGWILVTVLLAAAAVVLRRRRYPGAWRHTFGPEHRPARRDVGLRRAAVRFLWLRRQWELFRARGGVRSATAAHRRRVRERERRVAELREPGRGELRDELGPLRLHAHVLAVQDGDWKAELPLHEITVYEEAAGRVSVVDAQGRRHRLAYPAGETSAERVREFVAGANDVIADARASRLLRASLLGEAEAELRGALEDTSEQALAQRRLDETVARWDADPRVPKARQAREDSYDRWEALTGKRPR
ncbi:hypothetical protein ABT093_18295 [Kitasatospora sp. NPDC002551]|uniref:hypothetical protein n=1 Tax=unclassified Kitasatospora TaxID=2633591 RepID=UPI0033264CA0